MYYIANRFSGNMTTRSNPQKRRPELLLIAGSDHVELGSAIRSACAFGWSRVFVEDRHNVWFGSDHGIKREARAAARRAKNEIKVIPTRADFNYKFERATIVVCRTSDSRLASQSRIQQLHRAKLDDGPSQLIVLIDQSVFNLTDCGDFARLAATVDIAQMECEASEHQHQFRLTSAIAMAEVARQVGLKTPWKPTPQEPLYESALRTIADEQGEVLTLEELQIF